MFNSTLVLEYNISSELASYMLIPLDASMKEYIKFMMKLNPDDMKAKLQRLDKELNNVLSENNFKTTLDLFYATAVQ